MMPVDDQILELVYDLKGATPSSLAEELGMTSDYVGTRCRELNAKGLLRRPDRGYYRLAEAGERFLKGDLDASTLD